jgi:hypothetical protein
MFELKQLHTIIKTSNEVVLLERVNQALHSSIIHKLLNLLITKIYLLARNLFR